MKTLAVTAGGILVPSYSNAAWWALCGGVNPYAEWETNNSDGDTFACILDSKIDDSDEIGLGGGLSEADRTLTRVNTVPGNNHSRPPYRNVSSGYFTLTNNLMESLIADNSATWTVFIYLYRTVNIGLNRQILYSKADFNGVSYQSTFYMMIANNMTFFALIREAGVNDAKVTTNVIPFGESICCVWADGVIARMGFVHGHKEPTKWSDFDANERGEFPFLTGQWANWDGNGAADEPVYFPKDTVDYDVSRIKISKNCLIDNAA